MYSFLLVGQDPDNTTSRLLSTRLSPFLITWLPRRLMVATTDRMIEGAVRRDPGPLSLTTDRQHRHLLSRPAGGR